MEIKSTKDYASHGVKMLVYGKAGSGKTSLISTLPRPFAFSAEGGLLSLAGKSVDYIEIRDMATLNESMMWLMQSKEADEYDSYALDSVSEVAEVVLASEKKNNKDPRQAYGEMQTIMSGLIRHMRDVQGKHVYLTAKIERSADSDGRVMYQPSMPGTKLASSMPYFFDELFALRVEKDEHGAKHRMLMCDSDGQWEAKDRSGKLDDWEVNDLGKIIEKITG